MKSMRCSLIPSNETEIKPLKLSSLLILVHVVRTYTSIYRSLYSRSNAQCSWIGWIETKQKANQGIRRYWIPTSKGTLSVIWPSKASSFCNDAAAVWRTCLTTSRGRNFVASSFITPKWYNTGKMNNFYAELLVR